MHAYTAPIVSSSVTPFAFLARVSLPGSPRARHLPGLHVARPRHEKFRLPARPTPLPSFSGGRSLTNCRYTYRPTSQPAERSVALPSFAFKGTHSVASLSPSLSSSLSSVSLLCPPFAPPVSLPRALQGVSQRGKQDFEDTCGFWCFNLTGLILPQYFAIFSQCQVKTNNKFMASE